MEMKVNDNATYIGLDVPQISHMSLGVVRRPMLLLRRIEMCPRLIALLAESPEDVNVESVVADIQVADASIDLKLKANDWLRLPLFP